MVENQLKTKNNYTSAFNIP